MRFTVFWSRSAALTHGYEAGDFLILFDFLGNGKEEESLIGEWKNGELRREAEVAANIFTFPSSIINLEAIYFIIELLKCGKRRIFDFEASVVSSGWCGVGFNLHQAK